MPTKEIFFCLPVHIHTGIPITIIAPQHNKNNMTKYIAGISFRVFIVLTNNARLTLKTAKFSPHFYDTIFL